MSTAQQLGLIGNSIKVQSLPTASAETFGAGNRFYTLIGQQEGYITGHTYHTVVVNDVYSWEDVACGNYNMLDNIPVINQDLSASGFTPVANTYYRHTGATTDTFTQGVIYLYDTAYHKLAESSGGTTLNKYTYTQNTYNTAADNIRLMNILRNAKGRVICASWGALMEYGVNDYGCRIRKTYYRNSSNGVTCEIQEWTLKPSGAYGEGYEYKYNMTTNTLTTRTIENGNDPQATISIVITYYNDTEIT